MVSSEVSEVCTKHQGRVPPGGFNLFIVMQFAAKKSVSTLTLGVGAQPKENPGSATAWQGLTSF